MTDEFEGIKIGERSIRALLGDLTEMEADALVNAANNRLWMGGGVAGAIKKKGGKSIELEAIMKGPIPIGEAVTTTAGDLKAKCIIHAAGMGTDLRTDSDKVRSATFNALKRAHESKLKSIAFPAIGTGVGGFPVQSAAEIMVNTAIDFILNEEETTLNDITFVLHDDETWRAFIDELKKVLITSE